MFEWRPDYKQALFNIGMQCYKRKEYEKSENYLQKLLEKDAYFKPLEIYEKLGDIEIKKNHNWNKAKSLYEKVLGTSIVYHLLIKIGKCWENLGDNEKALNCYRRSLEGHSNYVWGLFHMGCLLTKMNEIEEGSNYLRRAYKQDKINMDVIIKYTHSLIKKGSNSDLDTAYEILSKVWEMNKNNIDININISKIYECWGNIHEAINYMENANKSPDFSSDPDKVYSLALLYEKSNSFPKAIQLYKNILAIKKDHVLALCRLGTLYTISKQYKRANKYFQFAYKKDRQCLMATYGLGKVYHYTNLLDNAIVFLKKAIDIDQSFYKYLFNYLEHIQK
jgi:tetratricopeptide (TPR) repeat protein